MINFLEKNKVLLVYTPLVIYWLIILAATSIPSDSMPSVAMGDKLNHFLAYFGLGVLLSLTLLFQNKSVLLRQNAFIFTFIFAGIYGALDEIHQIFIPGRSCDPWDWAADIIGASIGILFIMYLVSLDKKKAK